MLGFETSKELRIAHGAQVDVVWRTRIGNLGTVTYVLRFIVWINHSLRLNLQKVKSNPTVQKLIAISDDKQLNRKKGNVRVSLKNLKEILYFGK